MINIMSILLGIAAFIITTSIGYFTNITIFNILLRGVLAFFVFYVFGMVVGVIITKEILGFFERKKKEAEEEKIRLKEQELEEKRKQKAKLDGEEENGEEQKATAE